MVSADILRGRYREDFSVARAIEPNKVLEYRIRLPQLNHTFLPGHRIMVQVQSSWFPLYDRNPQILRAEHHVRASRELREGDAPRLAHGGAGIRNRAASDPVAG